MALSAPLDRVGSPVGIPFGWDMQMHCTTLQCEQVMKALQLHCRPGVVNDVCMGIPL
jgi:hypothetical protein